MKILAIGDIVGGIAIDYLGKNLSRFVRENKIDFVIANGENASEIKGLSKNDAESLFNLGIDFITLGNHAFGKRDLYDYLENNDHKIIRPANFPPSSPGSGFIYIVPRTLIISNLKPSTETMLYPLPGEDGGKLAGRIIL